MLQCEFFVNKCQCKRLKTVFVKIHTLLKLRAFQKAKHLQFTHPDYALNRWVDRLTGEYMGSGMYTDIILVITYFLPIVFLNMFAHMMTKILLLAILK